MRYFIFAIIFIFFPMTASEAQTSFHQVDRYKTSIGIGHLQVDSNDIFENINDDYRFKSRSFQLSLDYGYTRDVKIALIPGVSFTTFSGTGVDIPPAPAATLQIMRIGELADTKLDYFLLATVGAEYAQVIRKSLDDVHGVTVVLLGGGGILHRFETQSDLSFVPFFGVYYKNQWLNLSTTRRTLYDESESAWVGNAGVELEFSPSLSIVGKWHFSFRHSRTLFHVSVNFH